MLESLHQDHLGSMILVTDSNGNPTEAEIYKPYGTSTTNSLTTSYQWTGGETDQSGLYYFNARFYDPELGRFISADPAVIMRMDVGLSIEEVCNPYMYARNNPVRYTDLTGLSSWINIKESTWWFRYDQSSGKDPAHYHFVKGDPRKARSDFYNRRVYPELKNPDGSIKQNSDRSGGRGGVDKDVPENIIQQAVGQKGGNGNSERVSLLEPLFGLFNVEKLNPTSVIVNQGEEGYPSWGNGNSLKMEYHVTRDKENGNLNFSLITVTDSKTGKSMFPKNITIPSFSFSPGFGFSPASGTVQSLSPILGY